MLGGLVVGIPDDRFGDVITSVKQLQSGYTATKRVLFVQDVPRAPNGKADYKTAKSLALA